MMDQEHGRFRPISEEKVAEMQKELDTVAAQSGIERKAARVPRVLPVLAWGEEITLVVGAPLGEVPVRVEKIKANGKLFVETAHIEALCSLPIGLVVEIKGVKFRLRRTNLKGQAGLRMMTSAEVAVWEAAGKPQPKFLVQDQEQPETSPAPNVECVLENPSNRAYPVSTDSQLRRAEQKERRLAGLAEKRKANRERQERDRATLPVYAQRTPEVKAELEKRTREAIEARRKRKAAARAARKPQKPVDPAVLRRTQRMVHMPDPSKVVNKLLATAGAETK